MPKRRPTYKQLPLPLNTKELYVPIRPVLPPGLAEFARMEKLTEAQVRQLAQAYPTMRGRKPATVEEWRTLWSAIKKFTEAVGSQS